MNEQQIIEALLKFAVEDEPLLEQAYFQRRFIANLKRDLKTIMWEERTVEDKELQALKDLGDDAWSLYYDEMKDGRGIPEGAWVMMDVAERISSIYNKLSQEQREHSIGKRIRKQALAAFNTAVDARCGTVVDEEGPLVEELMTRMAARRGIARHQISDLDLTMSDSLYKIRKSPKLNPEQFRNELDQKLRNRARYFRENPAEYVKDLGGFRPPIFDRDAKKLSAAYSRLSEDERQCSSAVALREKAKEYYYAGRPEAATA